jgi:aspartate aminotransferase
VSIAPFYPEGTIVSSGLSKWCGAGGWRLGTFCFPSSLDWLLDAMASVASETYTSVSAPIQYAAVAAFEGGPQIEAYLHHARRILAAAGRQCTTILQSAGIRVHAPDGGFYLWLDFSPLRKRLAARGIDGGAALCDRLLAEANVAVLPGVAFARSRRELSARLAYVDFDGAQALQASADAPTDGGLPPDFVRRWCERVVVGAERIAQWVTS